MNTAEPVWACYVCGAPATRLVRLAGEDERVEEEAVCEEHAKGHWRAAVLAVMDLREVGLRGNAPESARARR